MIPEEQLQEFIADRVVTQFGDVVKNKKNNWWEVFVLNYYDAYALLALTKTNIAFMNEDVMLLIKPHKKSIYFRIAYDPKFQTFELRTLIFAYPLTQCIKVVTSVKQILAKHNIGTHIQSTTFTYTHKYKKTCTLMDIIKIVQ